MALADGLKAAYANPAGLTLIPVSEAQYSSSETWFAAGTGRARFRMAGYFTRTGFERAESRDFGAGAAVLDRSVTEAGLAFGAEVVPRLRVGASAAWSRLDVDGPTITADKARIRMSAGVMLLVVGRDSRSLPSVRLGVSYQPGFNWSGQAPSASDPAESRSIDIRRPAVINGGVAWRVSDRWSYTVQGHRPLSRGGRRVAPKLRRGRYGVQLARRRRAPRRRRVERAALVRVRGRQGTRRPALPFRGYVALSGAGSGGRAGVHRRPLANGRLRGRVVLHRTLRQRDSARPRHHRSVRRSGAVVWSRLEVLGHG